MPWIETERLRLRPLTTADADALHRLWTHPEVRRYLWDDRVILKRETAEILEKNEILFREKGLGLWAMLPKEAITLIGFCGYWFFHEPPELQLLYGVTSDAWGRGLATEGARAMIRYGFEALGFARIAGSTDAPNAASIRVMQKAGMTFEKRVLKNGLDTVYYALGRTAFAPDDSLYRAR